MLLSQTGSLAAGWCSSSRPCSGSPLLPAQQLGSRRSTACHAKRGRPPKNKTTTEDAVADATAELEPAPAKRKGRKPKTEVEPAPTTAEAPLTVQTQPLPVADHEKVISIEDMMTSVELDYTENPALIVPSYTHQAQGHESATQPPLDNYVPYSDSPGFVGSEELPRQQAAAATAAAAEGGPLTLPLSAEQRNLQQLDQPWQQPDQPWQLQDQAQQQQEQQGLGVQVMQQQQQQLVGPSTVGAPASAIAPAIGEGPEEEEDDELLGYDDPPGLFDYEAGLAYATIEPPPENPMQTIPRNLRAKSRREADYLLRYISYLGNVERQEREVEYKERALYYHLRQVKESNNVYLTGKALSVVMAEIELEDAQTGNRTDSFYPTWARAEHRWYPSGRFAAYNEYVGENLPDLTVKYAPGADQEVDFDIMDDVLLMADDPSMPVGGDDEDEDEGLGSNPAAGLSIDAFMGAGLLPGAGSSELGAAYIEDVLAPAGDEELEEELLD